MNVQQLIDELLKVEDKTNPVLIYNEETGNYDLDEISIEIDKIILG